MYALRSALLSLAGLFVFAPTARAQDISTQPAPPHIAFVDGAATIDREDGAEPAAPGAPFIDGDRLTTLRGRVEIAFPDGSILDVDENSSVELAAPAFLRVSAGRVLLLVAGVSDPATAPRFQVDTPTASVRTLMPGEYRISLSGGPSGSQTELAVLRGSATLSGDRATVPLRAGERSVAWENVDPSHPQGFNSARVDAFDRWADGRRDDRLAPRHNPYLPSEVRGYGGMLDRAGTWSYDAPYGYVWYPNVAAGWRPYSEGRWSSFSDHGWMWIGATPWSWPTHHYGRWGYTGARWYWIPGRTFAPAWVSWGGAPGYVSWCPLGFDDRPVFALSLGTQNAWLGWTVMSRDHFGGRGYRVGDYALRTDRLPRHTPLIAQAPPPPTARQPAARRFSGYGLDGGPNRGDQSFRGRDREGSARANPLGWRRKGALEPAPGSVPPMAGQPAPPAAPERPRYGAAYRRSPQDVNANQSAPPDAAPATRARRPPDARPRVERAPGSYWTVRPSGREERAAPPTPAAPPDAREQRPGSSGDGGRAHARPRDGSGEGGRDGGRRAGSGRPSERPSGSDSGRGSRRPR